MIQAFHLTKADLPGVVILQDAYFSVPEGSFTVVLGDNPFATSALFKVLAGEAKPDSGTVRVDHHDIYGFSSSERHRWLLEVGLIFPDLKLFFDKTVEENILFILHAKGVSGPGQSDAILKLLSKAGMGDKLKVKVEDLSVSEKQMVLALRAMIFRPRLLLAEDPFRGLDAGALALLVRFFAELNKTGTTIVLSTKQTAFWEETKKIGEGLSIQWVKLEDGKIHPLEEKVS